MDLWLLENVGDTTCKKDFFKQLYYIVVSRKNVKIKNRRFILFKKNSVKSKFSNFILWKQTSIMDQQNYFLDPSETESNEDHDYPDDSFICGICRDIYLDPHELIPCEHVFCETCLRRLNQARISNCPICRRQIRNTMPVENLRNQIMEAYPQHVQERAEAEQESNVYSLDLPPFTPGWMELIHTIFGMQFQIDLHLRLVLHFGFRELLSLLMVVLVDFFRLIMRIREENFHSIPIHMAAFFMKILVYIVVFFFLQE